MGTYKFIEVSKLRVDLMDTSKYETGGLYTQATDIGMKLETWVRKGVRAFARPHAFRVVNSEPMKKPATVQGLVNTDCMLESSSG